MDAPTTTEPLHGVFYTDGGCRSSEPKNPASRGQAGWGMHGYIYSDTPPKVGAGVKRGVPTKVGYDIKGSGKGDVTIQQYVDAFVSIPGESTNQVAELVAATEAVKFAIKYNLASCLIITDSMYVVKGSTEYMHRWKANGWTKADRTPIANKELWVAFDEAIISFKATGGKFDSQWVKAHNGDPGNVLADRFATRAVLAYQQGSPLNELHVNEAKGYWKAKYERNRMLSLITWYFTTSGDMDITSPDGRSIYYIGDIRDTEEFTGKRISDASYAVVYLKEPEIILDQLYQHFVNLSKGSMQGLILGDLRTIFHADIYDALNKHGDKLLVMNRQRQSVEHMDKLREEDRDLPVLGREIRPTRLAYNAVNVLESLEVVLNRFLEGRKDPTKAGRVISTEITDVLYEQSVVKTKTQVKLKSTVLTNTRSVDVPVGFPQGAVGEVKTVCLTLGQDLPDRNTLAALAVEGITVYVVTWPESAVAFRFAVIVEAQGDTGIYSGPYSNLQLIERPAK